MASELAQTIVRAMRSSERSLADCADTALAPVRQCLEGLRNTEGCWCASRQVYTTNYKEVIMRKDDDHDPECQRARELWNSLQVKE